VNNHPSFSSLPSECNSFLFAPICEEAGGMQLSVLSALARINVDPWEETTRLAAMPKAIAVRAIVSLLARVSGGSSSEAEVIAARLVQLLPQSSENAPNAPTDAVKVGAQRTKYWLVWLSIAIAMSLLSPHHQAAVTDADVSTSNSIESSPLKNGSANSTLPGAND
jgi:hypothetical protein